LVREIGIQLSKSPIRQLANCLVALLFFTSCSTPSGPTAADARVDVLSYLLGDAALWPRVGSHSQNQIVDVARREVCWVKYANPRRFECWRWDEQHVYHAVDHGLDGDSNESYRFTDGRWLPRYLPAGTTAAAPWTIDVSRNQIVWFDASCRIVPARSYAFPYRMRAWIEPRVDAGPDLGRRDALLFEYEPYDPAAPQPGAHERFSMALGAGWYRWERSGFVDMFHRLGGPAVAMNRSVWCEAGS
jgi:hypothetical protein